MEGFDRTKKKYHLASYYKSGALSFGALLFCASQVLRFIQLFRDAAARKAANQAPPENYTAAGITWAALIIVLIAFVCVLLLRNRKGVMRMKKSRAYLLLSVLLTLWGLYYFVTFIIEMIRNSELTLLFDIVAVGAGVIAPVLLLQTADITGDMVDDMTLLICGIGGSVLSLVSLVVLIILRKGYANAQLLLATEMMFRVAMTLCSLAALLKAIRIRNSYPVTVEEPPARREREPAPKPRGNEEAPLTLRFDNVLETYGKPENRPKARAKQHVESLLSFAEEDFLDETPARPTGVSGATSRTPRPAPAPTWDTGRVIVQGGTGRIPTQDPGYAPSERQTCPYCGKRMPVGFPNCPRCGRDM